MIHRGMIHRYRGVNVGGERHFQRHINCPPSKSMVHTPPSKRGHSRCAFMDANLSLCRRVETVHDWRHLPRREALLFWARRLMGPENTRVVLHFRRAATRQQRGSKFRIALYRARPHHHEVCVCVRESE